MKIGLIGYGFMGGAHFAAMQTITGVEVVAVASLINPFANKVVRGNLSLKAEPLPESVRWTPDWRDVVNDPEIDAVDICLPTPMHREVAEAALARRKHVLCEKPMALTPVDCDALLAAAQRSGCTFMVAQVLRFTFPYKYARDFVRAAPITSCTLSRSAGFPQWSAWLRDEKASGGAILDMLCHDLDQVLQWFGIPHTLSATSMGDVDTARAVLYYDNLNVVVEGGWLQPAAGFKAGFHIATGTSALTFADGRLTQNNTTVEMPERDPYADEIAYFVECCRTGSAPILCPPAESANAVRAATLLKQSRDENGKKLAWR